MRKNLYLFRHSKKLSQLEMAEKLGYARTTYAAIENGEREGRKTFWDILRKTFGLTDAEIEELKEVDKTE